MVPDFQLGINYLYRVQLCWSTWMVHEMYTPNWQHTLETHRPISPNRNDDSVNSLFRHHWALHRKTTNGAAKNKNHYFIQVEYLIQRKTKKILPQTQNASHPKHCTVIYRPFVNQPNPSSYSFVYTRIGQPALFHADHYHYSQLEMHSEVLCYDLCNVFVCVNMD